MHADVVSWEKTSDALSHSVVAMKLIDVVKRQLGNSSSCTRSPVNMIVRAAVPNIRSRGPILESFAKVS